MSRRQCSIDSGNVFAELELDESRLSGNGGADCPRLFWQIEMALRSPKAPLKDFAFRLATAQLLLSNGMKIAESHPYLLQRVMQGFQEYGGSEYLNFEFPLDATRIAAIERVRHGGSLQLSLHVQVQMDELGLLPAHPELKRPQLWGVCAVHVMRWQESIQISQTQWVERVLPQIGYGKVHIIELPAAPLDACSALDHSFKALTQAVEKHRLGFYDDAVGKCRVALDPFFDHVSVDPNHPDSRKIPVLKKSWETKLGEATYQWLNATLSSIKNVSNVPHHSPKAYYSHFDSQMILAITTAVVAYVARTIPAEDLKR